MPDPMTPTRHWKRQIWRLFCACILLYTLVALVGATDAWGRISCAALLLLALNELMEPRHA